MTQPRAYQYADLFIPLAESDRRVKRARLRGLIIGGTIVGALAYALPAWAGDTASWQGTGCTLVPVEGQAHVAEVRCRNILTSGSPFTAADMTAGDLTVGVAIAHSPGDEPDTFTITAPPGFYADPPTLVLDENSRGVALIFPWVGM